MVNWAIITEKKYGNGVKDTTEQISTEGMAHYLLHSQSMNFKILLKNAHNLFRFYLLYNKNVRNNELITNKKLKKMKKLSEMTATEKAFKILEAVHRIYFDDPKDYIYIHPFTLETEEERKEVFDAITDLLITDDFAYLNEYIIDYYFNNYQNTIIEFAMYVKEKYYDLWEDEIFTDAA